MTHPVLTLALSLALFTAMWPVSLILKDVGVVDILWAPAFGLIGTAVALANGGVGPRGAIILVLVWLWAVRLGGHIFARHRRSTEEDSRYAAIRRKFGNAFPLLSLGMVFWLQALLLWLISWPLQVAVAAKGMPVPLDYIAWAITLCGIVVEALADLQLTAFRRHADSKERVLDTGLWRYSRHPNYFGDFLIWWGFALAGLSASAPWWTLVSPIVMSALLIHYSGAALMEETITDRRAGYKAYIARTSAFIPWPPRR